MSAIMGSQRYTKDIDLDQDPARSLASLQRLVRTAIDQSARGFLNNLKVTEPKQTDTVARWKVEGISTDGVAVHLTLEVSRRPAAGAHAKKWRYVAPHDARVSTVLVDGYDASSLLTNKIFCLSSERRNALRDLYDAHLLISRDVFPDGRFFDASEQDQGLSVKVWNKLEFFTWDQYRQEVFVFLRENERDAQTEGLFDEMRTVVGSAVEQWCLNGGRDKSAGSAP